MRLSDLQTIGARALCSLWPANPPSSLPASVGRQPVAEEWGCFRQHIRRRVGAGTALEIGASYGPILPKKDGFRVTTVDHLTAAELRAKYAHLGSAVDAIEHVNYVWREGPLHRVFARQSFDAVVSSHLLEHQPDLLGFLQDCSELLRPGGEVLSIVPDKRFCFDYFQPLTDVATIIRNHECGVERHGFESLYRASMAVTVGERLGWGQEPFEEFRLIDNDPKAILQRSKAFADRGDYVDAHAGYFTPTSLRLIVSELHFLGLIDLAVTASSPAQGCEFLIVFEKVGPCGLTLQEFAAEKHRLLRQLVEEDAARVHFARALFAGRAVPTHPDHT